MDYCTIIFNNNLQMSNIFRTFVKRLVSRRGNQAQGRML